MDTSCLEKGMAVEAMQKDGSGWVDCTVRKVHAKSKKVDVAMGKTWWRVTHDRVRLKDKKRKRDESSSRSSSASSSSSSYSSASVPVPEPPRKVAKTDSKKAMPPPPRPQKVDEVFEVAKFHTETVAGETPVEHTTIPVTDYNELAEKLTHVFAIKPDQLQPYGKVKNNLVKHGVELHPNDIAVLATTNPPVVSYHWNHLTSLEQTIHNRGSALCEGSLCDVIDGHILMLKLNKIDTKHTSKVKKELNKPNKKARLTPPVVSQESKPTDVSASLNIIKTQSDKLLQECSIVLRKAEVATLSLELDRQLEFMKKLRDDLNVDNELSGIQRNTKAQRQRVGVVKSDADKLQRELVIKKRELRDLGVDVERVIAESKKAPRQGSTAALMKTNALRQTHESKLLHELELEQQKEGLQSLYAALVQWGLLRVEKSEPQQMHAITVSTARAFDVALVKKTFASLSSASVEYKANSAGTVTLLVTPRITSVSLLSAAWTTLNFSSHVASVLTKHSLSLHERRGTGVVKRKVPLSAGIVKELAIAMGASLEGTVMAAIETEGVPHDPTTVLLKVKVPSDSYLMQAAVKEVKGVLTDPAAVLHKYSPTIVGTQALMVPVNCLKSKRSWCFRANMDTLVNDLTSGQTTQDPTQRKAGTAQLKKSYKEQLKLLGTKVCEIVSVDPETEVVRLQLGRTQDEFNEILAAALKED